MRRVIDDTHLDVVADAVYKKAKLQFVLDYYNL